MVFPDLDVTGRGLRPAAKLGRASAVLPVIGLVVSLLLAGCARRPEFRTIVLVTIDTLRADHLGAYGYPRPTTPFLDSLAKNGVLFEGAYASSSHTAPSHATLFTSLYPEAHGVLRNGARLAAGEYTTLADELAGAGFSTAAFSGIGFLKQIAQGFEHVDTWPIPPGTKRIRLAEETVSVALDWLRSRDPEDRLFLWVHLYDVHAYHRRQGPHTAMLPRFTELDAEGQAAFEGYLDKTYPRRRVKRQLRVHLDHYDAQLAYVDEEIGRLYRQVAETREGSSLWVITSDHGEGLGNHGYMGHGRHLYGEQLRVPLIVHSSEPVWQSARVRRLVRLVDLLPTIRNLAGVSSSTEATGGREIEGVSLVPLLEDPEASVSIDALFAQRRPAEGRRWRSELVLAAQDGRHKYIYHSELPDEFYDLEADPRELDNRVNERTPPATRLKLWLLERYETMRAERPEASEEIAPEHLEELRALGYIN